MRLKDEIKNTFGIGGDFVDELKGKVLTVKAVLDPYTVSLEDGYGFAWHINMLEPVSISIDSEIVETKTPEEIVAEMEEEVIEVEEMVEDVKTVLAKQETEIACLKAKIEVYESIIDRFFIHTDMTSVINHFKEDKDE